MKLRTKLTLFSILLIVAAITVCCMLILNFTQKSAMQDVTETCLSQYSDFYNSFGQAIMLEMPNEPVAMRSELIRLFRAGNGFNEFSLRKDDDFLFNNTGFDIERLFSDKVTATNMGIRTMQYQAVRTAGTDYFVVHAIMVIGTDGYDISFARDISAVTNNIRALAVKCLTVGLLVTAVSVAAMWLLVYRALKPIEKLKAGAAELARGNYEKRIVISGKNELTELAADFNGMADAIETTIGEINEKSERQQTFINDLSHELKTPITSILLCSETLLNRKVPPETQSRSLERIYDQGRWLETLSQKLMTLVMLQGEITMQPESVPALLGAVKEATINALHEQGMELITDCSMDALPMDFDLLRSALTNLVVNARKASSDGQTIEIHAQDLTIAVVDHGRGIPKEEIARITEPFYMVDRSRSKKSGGSGLGLALVNRIAEAHGASLSIESALGQGTTVRLTFQSAK